MCCRKEDSEPEPAPPDPTPAATYHASFTAIRSMDDLGGGVPVSAYSARASFTAPDGSPVEMDTVRVNGLDMVQVIAGQYVATDVMGLDLSTEELVWVAGDADAGSDITEPVNDLVYPSVGVITSADTVPDGAGYTLTCDGVSGADSVVFVLGSLQRTLAGNVATCTFSAAEVQGLGAELYMASITALRVRHGTIGEVACRFGKGYTRSVMILVE
ncbi:MAG: hypothetical protein IT225_05660 [Flavobacteriales bacterium]|nr:hypothetical protein [Flavobacteriales bacterium]